MVVELLLIVQAKVPHIACMEGTKSMDNELRLCGLDTCFEHGNLASTFDWLALRASTCCLISWWIAPEQPQTAGSARSMVNAAAAGVSVVVVATSAVGCGRVDEEQEQEEGKEEEEDVASGSNNRERRRRRR